MCNGARVFVLKGSGFIGINLILSLLLKGFNRPSVLRIESLRAKFQDDYLLNDRIFGEELLHICKIVILVNEATSNQL